MQRVRYVCPMVRLFACIALIFLLVPVASLQKQVRPRPQERSQIIRFEPVPLDVADPDHVRLGGLTYLAGWRLTSSSTQFGGISALLARGHGSFLGLSDGGVLFGFSLPQPGKLASRSSIRLLPDLAERDSQKGERDTESLVYDVDTGRYWTGLEVRNAIARYASSFARLEKLAEPAAMQDWPGNGGAEAMVKLSDGRFLVFSEEGYGPDNSTAALMFSGDPTDPAVRVQAFGYRPPQGYRVTDAALLPDGRVILTNRRFTILEGFSAAITVADPGDIRPGKPWQGEEIARLKSPLTVDNMEGVSVTQEDGDTIVWLVSDDNFLWFQKTLLLKFRLDK